MSSRRFRCSSALPALLCAAWGAAALSAGAAPAPELPEVLPNCYSPQLLSPPQSLGNSGNYSNLPPALAWNGADYGSLTVVNNGVRFGRIYADGTPAAAGIQLPTTPPGVSGYTYSVRPALAWTGSGYGAAWGYYDSTLTHWLIAFAVLNPDGVVQGAVQRVAFVGAAPTVDASNPSLAWSSFLRRFVIAWQDNRSGTTDIYATVVDANGTLTGANTHDILVSRDGTNNPLTGNQANVKTTILPGQPQTAAFYWDDTRAVPSQIYTRSLSLYTDGTAGYFGNEYQISNSPTGGATLPAVAAGTSSLAIAWQDARNGPPDIYAARLDGYQGNRPGVETRVTSTAGNYSYTPAIAWTGSEFGILFDYYAGGISDLYFARLAANGSLLGGPYAITNGWLSYVAAGSELAFGKAGFLAGSSPSAYAGTFSIPIGCNYDYNPPPCPANLQMTTANWNSATFAWDSVLDPDGDEVAYYELFKDRVSVGRTSGQSLTVSGLTPGFSSSYELYAVDSSQRRMSACPAQSATPSNPRTSCNQPRQAGATSTLGAAVNNTSPSLVANGTDFAGAYVDPNSTIWFQRYYANGQPRGARVQVAQAQYPSVFYAPGLSWDANYNQYGIAWYGGAAFYFARLDANGGMIGAPLLINAPGGSAPNYTSYQAVSIANNGGYYAVAWEDNRNSATTGLDIYATLVNANNGTIAGPTNNFFDIVVSNAAGNQRLPAMVWTGNRFLVAFDQEGVSPQTIQTVRLDPATGTVDAAVTVVTPPAGGAFRPALAMNNGYYTVIAWQDTRTGTSQIFANALYNNGQNRWSGSDYQVSLSGGAYNASLAFDPSGYYATDLVWNDSRDGTPRIYLQKLTTLIYSSGASYAVSPPLQGYQLPAVAIGGNPVYGEMVLAGTPGGSSNLGLATSLSCVADPTPPTCPVNVTAASSGATGVGLTWSAATAPASGVDSYVIVRNGRDVASTTKTTYTDTVASGATYSYAIQPVNWGGTRNFTCAQNASVTMPIQPGSCPQGQAGAPTQPLGGAQVARGTPIVWNGSSFATLWHDQAAGTLNFELLYADGRPIAGSKTTVATGIGTVTTYGPALVWDGTGYGAAWFSDTAKLYYFVRLGATGVPLAAPTQVSATAETNTLYNYFTHIGLATNGSGYAVTWTDGRNFTTTGSDILLTLLKADGTIDGPAGAWHDLALDNTAGNQYTPVIAWAPVSARYVIAWTDSNHPISWIYSATANPADGTIAARSVVIGAESVYGANEPALAPLSSGNLGMAWIDYRDVDTSNAVYFTFLNGNGQRAGGETRTTFGNISGYHPALVWNGAEFGVFWNDSHTGVSQIWYQRIDAGGNPVGVPVQVTNQTETHFPRAAWGGGNFLVTSHPYNSDKGGANTVSGLGCRADATPPACPGNLLAYNITGTQATVSWSPASDPESGVSHYVFYRNNAELARTAATVFTDTGLGLSTSYNYMVQPVNGYGVQNTACTASIYVKTNATLTLTLNKSTPDAVLNWTDAGMNSYSIFKGVSPQVMTKVGATPNLTAPDPKALTDNNSYFYTVDDPGP